jgi:hypothetical protein
MEDFLPRNIYDKTRETAENHYQSKWISAESAAAILRNGGEEKSIVGWEKYSNCINQNIENNAIL